MYWSHLSVADLILFWLWYYNKTGILGSWFYKLYTFIRNVEIAYYLSKRLSPKVRSMYLLYQPDIRMTLGPISNNNGILSFFKKVCKRDRWKMLSGYFILHFFIGGLYSFQFSYLKCHLRVTRSWSYLIYWVRIVSVMNLHISVFLRILIFIFVGYLTFIILF